MAIEEPDQRRKMFADRGATLDMKALPASLQRGELTRQAKKEHLYSKNVRGDEAEEILSKLYPEGDDA